MSNVTIIPNLLNEDEVSILERDVSKCKWLFESISSLDPVGNNNRIFWKKDLANTKATTLFLNKIKHHIKYDIDITDFYCNGQSHSQCSHWHSDSQRINTFTMVYFYKEWQPEYGGHLMVKKESGEVISILPEYNKAVLFESKLLHMALGPSVHCLTQRESLSCKFIVLP